MHETTRKRFEIDASIKKQELGQRYALPPKKEFYPITAPAWSYQADLIFYPKTKVINNGYDTALTVIEITSRRGYCYPMKGKTTNEVLTVTKKFLKEAPEVITDQSLSVKPFET